MDNNALFFLTLRMRFGILSTILWIVSFGIFFHSSWILSQSSSKFFKGFSYTANFLVKSAHKFSIGFRSGLCEGHFISWKFWFESQFLATCFLWIRVFRHKSFRMRLKNIQVIFLSHYSFYFDQRTTFVEDFHMEDAKYILSHPTGSDQITRLQYSTFQLPQSLHSYLTNLAFFARLPKLVQF